MLYPLKAVSYSLFSVNGVLKPHYLLGMLANLLEVRDHYPDFEALIYVDDIARDALRRHYKNATLIRVTDPICPYAWRFLALENASVVLSRDSDSRITAREAAAVREWLTSGKRLHVMRDDPHHGCPIMGGMFGLRGPIPEIRELLRDYHEPRYNRDQEFLESMYERYKDDMMVHDDSRRYSHEMARPFPLPLMDGNYVGKIIL